MLPQDPILTVVVPVYNEVSTLRPSLERLLKTHLPIRSEVVVVDDGSVDGGIDTIADLEDPDRVRIIQHDRNRGKGAAVRTGIDNARGDVLTVMDADLEYDPADYAQLLEPLLSGDSDVVYGTRSFGAHTAFSFWYVIGNRVISLWASFLFNTWLSDVETCFKVAPTPLWREMQLKAKGFGIEAESTAKFLKGKHRIYEIPIHYKARTREQGKKLKWTDGLQAIWILLKLRLWG